MADSILKLFERTTDSIFSEAEFKKKLASGRKLRVKYGVDVTAPLLHTGHAVNLWLMRTLQNRGHKVVFLIGDFTTRIGDPSGRNALRPVIPQEEIEKNAQAFIEQAKMVLRFDDPDLLEIRRNSEWYEKMPVQEFLNLLSMVTHARLISRDMFQKRIEDGQDIYMHEMLYPVLQGYDSVVTKSDLTIIGSDQLFNEMMGRFFQEKFGQPPQTVLTTKITPGIDGKAKQSKSLGNYIGLGHSPRDKFGRVMSIPDPLIDQYFRIYTDVPIEEIDRMAEEIARRPRDAKIKLAYAIVGRYHGHEIAAWEREWFENTVSRGQIPDDIPTLPVMKAEMPLLELVQLTRPDKSRGDTRRLIRQGGVELDGQKRTDPDQMTLVRTNDILKVGKRNWYRIEVVRPSVLESERLLMTPMRVDDIDLLQKYLPEWELAKYMTKPLAKKDADMIMREVFKRIIMQPEPKDEWLWRIELKSAPGKIVGLAHLRRDDAHGNENIWLDQEIHDQGLLEEAISAINEHAFHQLGFNRLMFNKAFSHAAAPQEMSVLRTRFMGLDPTLRNKEDPEGIWGFTKEGWQLMKQQISQMTPENKSLMTDNQQARQKKDVARKQKRDAEAAAAEQKAGMQAQAPQPPKPSPTAK